MSKSERKPASGSAQPSPTDVMGLVPMAALAPPYFTILNTKVSVTHGFPWRAFVEGDHIVLSDAMWGPFKDSRIHLEVSFPIRIGDLFEYPYRETFPVLEAMVENIGADRLMYGTDMPFQNRFCTYRQSRDWIERYPTFLDPGQMAALMGGTAARILRIPG